MGGTTVSVVIYLTATVLGVAALVGIAGHYAILRDDDDDDDGRGCCCPGQPFRQGQLAARPYYRRTRRPADLRQIRDRSRQVSALGLYGEGREVLRSAGRLFDRSDRKRSKQSRRVRT